MNGERRVVIGPETLIKDVVILTPQATKVFENLSIDYCCGGSKPLGEACTKVGLSFERVLQMIEIARQDETAVEFDPQQASLLELIMHIMDNHHIYTKQEILRLDALMQKVITVHGENHPELPKLLKVFRTLADELTKHMFKEEQVLFPYVVELERALRDRAPAPLPPFRTAANPAREMAAEHDEAGQTLRKLRQLANEYRAPTDACSSFRSLYDGLKAFEADLHQHIHLENNVLFPRAVELESRIQYIRPCALECALPNHSQEPHK